VIASRINLHPCIQPRKYHKTCPREGKRNQVKQGKKGQKKDMTLEGRTDYKGKQKTPLFRWELEEKT